MQTIAETIQPAAARAAERCLHLIDDRDNEEPVQILSVMCYLHLVSEEHNFQAKRSGLN